MIGKDPAGGRKRKRSEVIVVQGEENENDDQENIENKVAKCDEDLANAANAGEGSGEERTRRSTASSPSSGTMSRVAVTNDRTVESEFATLKSLIPDIANVQQIGEVGKQMS